MSGSDAVGIMLLSRLRSDDAMELTYLGLMPHARGKGLGRRMLAQGLATARNCGVKSMVLAVDNRNRPAQRLYAKMNFRVMMRRKVMYYSSLWQ